MHESVEDIGIVTAVNGKRITVEIAKGGGCKSCGMKGLCGVKGTSIILHFDTNGEYKIGDRVRVGVSSGTRILSAVLVFVFPLVALFGFFLAARQFTSEPLAILAGFAGMVIAFFVVKYIDKCIGAKINFQLGGKYEDMP